MTEVAILDSTGKTVFYMDADDDHIALNTPPGGSSVPTPRSQWVVQGASTAAKEEPPP